MNRQHPLNGHTPWLSTTAYSVDCYGSKAECLNHLRCSYDVVVDEGEEIRAYDAGDVLACVAKAEDVK